MQHSIPSLRTRLIARPRLIDALQNWRDYRTICIQAPTGFGKTTLAAMWLQDLSHQKISTAWWSLSEQDDEEDFFLHNLGATLEKYFPALHDAIRLHAASQLTHDALFHEFLRALKGVDRPFLLVLDDVHLLRSTATVRHLQMLIDHTPTHAHLMLLTRPPLSIDITRLRMNGALLEIDMHDLCLDAAEIDAVINQSRLAHLTPVQRRHLAEHTNGWIAGMQLALHSLPATVTKFDAAASMADAEDRWTEYLERELIQRLAPDLQKFLVSSSMLPYLERNLCAAALQMPTESCAQLLRRSTTETGFLTRFQTSNGSSTYRIHPVLKEVLLRRMHQTLPVAEQHELRRRTTNWLAQHDQVDAALAMLLPVHSGEETAHSTADLEFAADIIERACRPALLRADLTAVRRWIGRLPTDLIQRRPQLALESCWMAVHSLDPQLYVYLSRLQASLTQGAEQGITISHEMAAEIAILNALCAAFEGSFARLEQALQVASRMSPAPGSIADGYLHALRAYHLGLPRRGSTDRVRELYDAFAIFGRIGFIRGQVEMASLAGVIASSDGQRSVEEYTSAVEFIRQVGWERSSFGMHTHLWFAENLYNRDRIGEARHHLLRAVDLARSTGDAHAIEPHADVYLHLCDLAEGRLIHEDINNAAAQARWKQVVARSAPRILYVTIYNSLVRSLKLGRTDECWQIISDLNLTPDRIDPDGVPFSIICATAGALFSGHAVHSAGRLLEKFHARIESFDYPSIALRTRLLDAVYFDRVGQSTQAMQTLHDILPDVERMQMPRLIYDLPMLQPLLLQCDSPLIAQFLKFHSPTPAQHPIGLSEQELRVLRLLAEQNTTHEIAATLHVTYDTVRKHLKSCYRKMNVHGQVAAIQTARKRGIL
jgi:LuxR family maltose regulon positive regulatory protein